MKSTSGIRKQPNEKWCCSMCYSYTARSKKTMLEHIVKEHTLDIMHMETKDEDTQ